MRSAAILSSPDVYLLWQAPFVRKKLAPFLAHNRGARHDVILDVGCGPGTNAAHLRPLCRQYFGLDLSPDYVAHAARRFPDGRFSAADAAAASSYAALPAADLVILNSLMHHLSDVQVRACLAQVARKLTAQGRVHVIDLILPEQRGLPRALARLDRGEHARSTGRWRALLDEHFSTEAFEPFDVGLGPVALWELFYFRGRRRAAAS